MTGRGVMKAYGGNGNNSSYGGGGGGGRISVQLSGQSGFDSVTFQAHGGTGYRYGAAGTIYREDQSNQGHGELIIDNNGRHDAYEKTEVFETWENVGLLITQNEGDLELSDNAVTLEIVDGITENGGHISHTGGLIEFVNFMHDAVVNADTVSFQNLKFCAGKTHKFTAGTSVTVPGTLSTTGTASNQAVLKSTSDGSTWGLNFTGVSLLNDGVDVQDSDASAGNLVVAQNSTDSGNNTNWDFALGNMTIKQDGTAMFTSLAAALAVIPTWLPYSLTIQFLDTETYSEKNTIDSVEFPLTTDRLIILGMYDEDARTVLRHNDPGSLIVIDSDNIRIKGIKFDRTDAIDDSRHGINIQAGHQYIDIEACHLYGNGYFPQRGIYIYENVDNLNIKNNLFRRWGEAGIKGKISSGKTHNIYNNHFVKCQEGIYYTSYVADGIDNIWNNIFDMDGDELYECSYFYAIKIDGSFTPDDITLLDYNLYNFRTSTNMYLFMSDSVNYTSVAALQAGTAKEDHGIEDDPDFVEYCTDYHLFSTSPAIDAANGDIPPGDNDGYVRMPPGNIGCYEDSETGSPATPALPQIDKKQNATFWVKLIDDRVSGGSRPIRVDLDYGRIL
jgi:hypothetical protein